MSSTRNNNSLKSYSFVVISIFAVLHLVNSLSQEHQIRRHVIQPRTISSPPNGYCDVNETSTIYVPIIKTRQVTLERRGFLQKMRLKKPEVVTQTYIDQVEQTKWKLVRECCTGYAKRTNNVCEPICENGCPMTSYCYAPNQCKCAFGYTPATNKADHDTNVGGIHNKHHHCEPICSNDCGINSYCAQPDKCRCNSGYYRSNDKNLCEPICTNKCPPNSHCIAPEKCGCDVGYSLIDGECVIAENQDDIFSTSGTSTDYIDLVDSNESSEHTTEIPDYNSDVFPAKAAWPMPECPADWKWVNGKCEPSIFSSIEVECEKETMKCPLNAVCQLEQGFCMCPEGYMWYKMYNSQHLVTARQIQDISTTETVTETVTETDISSHSTVDNDISTEDYTSSTSEMVEGSEIPTEADSDMNSYQYLCLTEEELIAAKANGDYMNIRSSNSEEEDNLWTILGISIMGIAILIGAAIVTSWIVNKRSGKRDISGSNNLTCQYSRDSYEEKHMVL